MFFVFFRSKLGLFQSRISLQKASVKVRTWNITAAYLGRAFRCITLNNYLKTSSNTIHIFSVCFLKLKAKRSDCNSKATQARNDYLLTLAAANAHHDRYYHTDLLHCIQVNIERWKKGNEWGKCCESENTKPTLKTRDFNAVAIFCFTRSSTDLRASLGLYPEGFFFFFLDRNEEAFFCFQNINWRALNLSSVLGKCVPFMSPQSQTPIHCQWNSW